MLLASQWLTARTKQARVSFLKAKGAAAYSNTSKVYLIKCAASVKQIYVPLPGFTSTILHINSGKVPPCISASGQNACCLVAVGVEQADFDSWFKVNACWLTSGHTLL